jgi:flagellar hook protein FlgE
MGVVSSMATAISGLEAHGQMLATVTNNIVNANTTGFKSSRSEFHDFLADNFGSGGAPSQVGRGVQVGGITNLFTQGSITRTERSTDLAINGNGFFVTKGDKNGFTYTRDGSFRFDKEGWLTNLQGSRVQAYGALPDGNISGKLDDVRIPFNTIPARPTDKIDMHVNLDARAKVQNPIDLTKPAETSTFSTAMQLFDSIGNAHSVNMFFTKTGEGTWEWHAMTDGANLNGGVAGNQEVVSQGTLLFDEFGKLATSEQQIVNSSFANGAIPDQNLRFEFGDPTSELGTGTKGTTSYGSKSSTFRSVQDGYAAGVLSDASISDEGVITGVYTNGQNKTLGQLGIARFEATERLAKVGDNQFSETVGSGQAQIGKPNTNGRGTVTPLSLEESNVDLAKEFVDMIKAQRGFQASAKSITSANEMLDEVIKIAGR